MLARRTEKAGVCLCYQQHDTVSLFQTDTGPVHATSTASVILSPAVSPLKYASILRIDGLAVKTRCLEVSC